MIEVKHEMIYAKGKPMGNMSSFEFHPDNVPEMICQRGEVTKMIKDDLISRQAAINQITKRFDDIQMLDWEKYPNAPFIQSGLLWSINTIRDLPSAQQKDDVKPAEHLEQKEMITMKNIEIENNFTYHAPKDDQVGRYISIREKAKQLAYMIDELCPESRERSLAMTKLEECVMWANAAIARNEDGRT